MRSKGGRDLKKLAFGLIAITLGLNIVPMKGTLSFLTSEKRQVSAVSTGSNEDVFVTETERIELKTTVTKRVTVKRSKNADGSTSSTTESRTSIQEGVQRISFVPQRDHLNLEVENITVTGLDEDEITIERIEQTEGEQGIVFRIAHNRQMVDRKTKTEKGELHVTALGGFYSITIPITVRTAYSSSTDVSEEGPANPAPQPDGSPAPAGPSEPVGPSEPAGPSEPTGPTESTGPAEPAEPGAPPSAEPEPPAGSAADPADGHPAPSKGSDEQQSSSQIGAEPTSTDEKASATGRKDTRASEGTPN